MTKSKWMLAVALEFLMYGLAEAKTASAGGVQKDTVVAAEGAARSDASGGGSAKMGQGGGRPPREAPEPKGARAKPRNRATRAQPRKTIRKRSINPPAAIPRLAMKAMAIRE